MKPSGFALAPMVRRRDTQRIGIKGKESRPLHPGSVRKIPVFSRHATRNPNKPSPRFAGLPVSIRSHRTRGRSFATLSQWPRFAQSVAPCAPFGASIVCLTAIVHTHGPPRHAVRHSDGRGCRVPAPQGVHCFIWLIILHLVRFVNRVCKCCGKMRGVQCDPWIFHHHAGRGAHSGTQNAEKGGTLLLV